VGSHLAFSQILVSTSRTDAANHLLPLAVGMPRSLRAPAMARSEVAPLACSSVITGARSRRARSCGLCVGVRALLAGLHGELRASTKAAQPLATAFGRRERCLGAIRDKAGLVPIPARILLTAMPE
jgi:hypothetical protein